MEIISNYVTLKLCYIQMRTVIYHTLRISPQSNVSALCRFKDLLDSIQQVFVAAEYTANVRLIDHITSA